MRASSPRLHHHRHDRTTLQLRGGLVLLALIYVFTGIIGHDPWQGEDVRHIAVVKNLLMGGSSWLYPQADHPANTLGPLFYWLAAGFALLLKPLLNLHDAVRLSTALYTLVSISALTYTAGQLLSRDHRPIALLLILGTLGLLIHSHEAQPLLLFMMAQCITLAGMVQRAHAQLRGTVLLIIGTLGAFFSTGVSALVAILPLWIIAAALYPPSEHPNRTTATLLGALTLVTALISTWLFALATTAPATFETWTTQQLTLLGGSQRDALLEWLGLVSWFTWPLWPLALWALWKNRHRLATAPLAIPLWSTLFALSVPWLHGASEEPHSLPLLPPLLMLATLGLPTLRRGAANAFYWFAVLTFIFFALLVVLFWSAQVADWPPGIARSMARTAPTLHNDYILLRSIAAAVIISTWLAALRPLARLPYRNALNWATGLVMLWCIAVILLTPRVEHDRSYRIIATAFKGAMASQSPDCIASNGVSDSQQAAFFYFTDLKLQPGTQTETECHYLLRLENHLKQPISPSSPWQLIWQGHHRGGKEQEVFKLYQKPLSH